MARNFNGSTQRLERASVPAVGAGPWTMACWARPNVNFGATQTAFAMGTTTTAGMYAALGLLTSAKAFLETKGTTQGAVDASGATVSATLNNWIHLAATCSGSGGTSHIFANGTDDGSASVGTVTAGTMNRTTIGGGYLQSATFGSNFKGDVCECAIWNVVLAQIDITMLALGVSPLMVQPTHLVFYAPVLGMSTEPDLLNATGLTLTAATVAAHVKMLNGRAAFNNPKHTSSSTPVSFSDSGAGTDAATLAAALAAVESGSGLDSAALAALMSLADTGVGSDAVGLALSGSDSGSGVDSSGALVAAIPGADAGSGADTTSSGATMTVADTGSGVDAPALQATPPAQADSGAGADATSLQAFPTAVDGGTGADGGTLGVATSGQDTGTGADAPTLAAQIAAADAGVGSDSVNVTTPGQPQFSDSGVGVDSVSVVVKLSSSDSGTGLDSATMVFATALAEAGAGTDTITMLAAYLVAQLGTGVDTLSPLLARIASTDTGTGTDTGTPRFSTSTSDAGVGVDAVSVRTGSLIGTIQTGSIAGPSSGTTVGSGGGTVHQTEPVGKTGSVSGGKAGSIAKGRAGVSEERLT